MSPFGQERTLACRAEAANHKLAGALNRVNPYLIVMGCRGRLFFCGNARTEAINTTLVASAFKSSIQEYADAIQGDLKSHDSAAQRQDVRVVVLATQPRHGVIRA